MADDEKLRELSVDLAKSSGALFVLVKRNQNDLGEVRQRTDEIQLGQQKLALDFARELGEVKNEIARHGERIESLSPAKDSTARHSTELVRLVERQSTLESDKEDLEERIGAVEEHANSIAVAATTGKWRLAREIVLAVVSILALIFSSR